MHVRSICTPQRQGNFSTAAERSGKPTAANKLPSHRGKKPTNGSGGGGGVALGERSGLHSEGTQPHEEGDPEMSVPRCYLTPQPIGGKGCF